MNPVNEKEHTLKSRRLMTELRCPCGGVIFADTEDWEIPLCYDCYAESMNPVNEWLIIAVFFMLLLVIGPGCSTMTVDFF